MNETKEGIKSCDEDLSLKKNDVINVYDVKGDLVLVEDDDKMTVKNFDVIQKAISGDKKAFDELYLQSYRYVFFVVRQYIADDETAYDAIQETFIKVYKNISNISSPKAYYSWISSIAKNTAIDILRTTKFETNLSYDENNDTLCAENEREKDVSLDIETVLKKLEPQDAELLSLVYYDGMRVSQIAKMQGMPATTVYSRLKKAKRNLKAQLEVCGIDKSVYSGNFVAMITTAIRNIIGTAILSFSVAQQILNSVVGKKSKKELAIEKIILSHQKKLALKIASCLVAVCIVASCFTVLALTDFGNALVQNVETAVKETVETIFEGDDYKESQPNKNNSFTENNSIGESGNAENTSSENVLENILNSDNNSQNQTVSNNGTSSENNTHQNENSAPNNNTSDISSNQSSTSSTTDTSSNDSLNFDSDDSQILEGFTSPTIPTNFVPDCDPSQYNTVGNLAHNITLSHGVVARQGDWIYYAAESDEHWLLTNLCKVKTDGTNKQILVSGVCQAPYINVVGEWIYFVGGHLLGEFYFARVRTDGTGYQQLTDFKIDLLQVVGDVAYFCKLTSGEFGDYCRMNLKTGEITTLLKDIKDVMICITDKYFLYRPDGASGNLCVYDNKTGALVHDFKTRGIQVYNDKILVDDADGVALYDLDNLSAKPVKLSKYISSPFESVNYLFYSPYKGGVICDQIKTTDGNDDMGILTLSNFGFKAWPFDWTYANANDFTSYSTFDDGYVYCVIDKVLYRCLPDGSNLMVY